MNLQNIQLENVLIESDNGMVCSDVNGVKIKNLTLITKKLPVADFKNSRDVSVDGLFIGSAISPLVKVSGSLTGNIVFKNTALANPDKQLIIGKEVPANAVQVVK
jgi:hypothetical protein